MRKQHKRSQNVQNSHRSSKVNTFLCFCDQLCMFGMDFARCMPTFLLFFAHLCPFASLCAFGTQCVRFLMFLRFFSFFCAFQKYVPLFSCNVHFVCFFHVMWVFYLFRVLWVFFLINALLNILSAFSRLCASLCCLDAHVTRILCPFSELYDIAPFAHFSHFFFVMCKFLRLCFCVFDAHLMRLFHVDVQF